jgi:hypothetical protein
MEVMKKEYEDAIKDNTKKHQVEIDGLRSDFEIKIKRLQREKQVYCCGYRANLVVRSLRRK